MKRLLALALLAGCAACLPVKEPPPPDNADCQAGIANLAADWQGTGWWRTDDITCVDGGEGWAGYYNVEHHSIVLNAHYTYPNVRSYREVLAHEHGHPYWIDAMTPAQRDRVQQVAGASWEGVNPFEAYADWYGVIGAGSTTVYYGDTKPTPYQVATICAEDLMPC